MKEKRRVPRVHVKIPVKIAVLVKRTDMIGGGRWTVSRDLSELVMYVLYEMSIPVGTELQLTFDLPDVARNVLARGIVRRVERPEQEGEDGGMAVEFTDVLPPSKESLRKFIKSALVGQ